MAHKQKKDLLAKITKMANELPKLEVKQIKKPAVLPKESPKPVKKAPYNPFKVSQPHSNNF